MNNFIETLTSKDKNPDIPEEYNYFGKLIGSWDIDYTDNNISYSVKGEWHFSWVLEGMAIQDVIILPSRNVKLENPSPITEYGTSLRIYNPNTHVWNVVYGYTEKIFQLEAKKEEDMIVLTNIEDEKRKWVFVKIEDDNFHWQNITVKDNGDWHINADIYAKRKL